MEVLLLLNFLLRQVLQPALHRIASQLAMMAATYGFATGQIEELTAAITVIGGLLIDGVVRNQK
jgi:hypothetical protein